jgi:dihydropteroate synthase
MWDIGRRSLSLGERTRIMGVLNVTPDSFSDGGRFVTPEVAVVHATQMLEEGADIIDVGGESTRPGSAVAGRRGRERAAVSAQQEMDRVLPVIEAIRKARPEAIVSIDTYKAKTARAAVAAGAEIVNDVSGFTWDEEMARTVASLECGAVLMHTRGQPEQWRDLEKLEDPVGSTVNELSFAAQYALAAGVKRERIMLDPGFGFGKRFDENYPLFAHFAVFAKLGYPLLAGPSRKSFIGRTVGLRIAEIKGKDVVDQVASERLHGTIAAVTASVLGGAHVVRVHDVRPAVEAVAVADAILAAQ